MEGESIDIVEFLKARSREIESIEKSLCVSHKKTLLWQRMPYYLRRRNRNFDKRTRKKFSFRKKDRHFLRTHVFYAKRFFMLKMQHFSIPITRRVKSSKFIYKSQQRGFIFDESFREAYAYDLKGILQNYNENRHPLLTFIERAFTHKPPTGQAPAHSLFSEYTPSPSFEQTLHESHFGQAVPSKERIIQHINNEFEYILDGSKLITIGIKPFDGFIEKYECIISILGKNNYEFAELQDTSAVLYRSDSESDFLETDKILCSRSAIMDLFQKFSRSGLIPICLDEIHRLSLENDTVSVYDNVETNLYKEIEDAVNKEIIDKYERTPPAKRQRYDLTRLYLSSEQVQRYFIFRSRKGSCKAAGEIFYNEACVGRVVRSAYKYSCGQVYGLGFLSESERGLSFEGTPMLHCKNLGQKPEAVLKYME